MATRVTPRQFTVDEFHLMGQAGVFGEHDRVELIEGEVAMMTPIGSRHAACVKRLNALFQQALAPRFLIGVQDPVCLGKMSEPQPDLSVLLPSPDCYEDSHPGPEAIQLLVEVSEISVSLDRSVKSALYARHTVPQLWIVDLEQEQIDVLDLPWPEGYRRSANFARGTLIEFQGVRFSVDEILG